MKESGYILNLAKLQNEFERKKRKLMREFALSNNTVKADDIVTDHIGSIKVECIKIYIPLGKKLPACKYIGIELKKDKTPRKDKSKRVVYQKNLTGGK